VKPAAFSLALHEFRKSGLPRSNLLNDENPFISSKEKLPDKWKGYVIVPIKRRAINLAVVIIKEYHCY
jgi:hypothetical protein